MKINKVILLLLCIISLTNQSASTIDAEESLKTEISKEFNFLAPLILNPVKLAFDNNPSGSSSVLRGNGKVTINLPELKLICSTKDKKYHTDIIRIVIAHELGHYLQNIHQYDNSNTLQRECQADLISGFLIFQTTFQDMVNIGEKIQKRKQQADEQMAAELTKINDRILAVYGSVFDLGDEYSIQNDHPRGSERVTAIRTGIDYGNLYLASLIQSNEKFDLSYRKLNRDLLKIYKTNLGYLEGDNLISWSDRTARKIVHEDLKICRDIVVYNNFKWNTASNYPFLDYRQTITNIGNKRITISFFNQIYLKRKKDPENMLYWSLKNTDARTITLSSGESKTISSSIQWEATKTDIPSYLAFGFENSMYTCRTVSPAQAQKKTLKGDRFSIKREIPSEETILDILLSYRPGNLKDLIAGVGQLDEINGTRVEYPSLLKYPNSLGTSVVYLSDDKIYSIYIVLCNSDENTASKRLQTLIKTLANLGQKVNRSESRAKFDIYNITSPQNKLIGRIMLSRDDNGKVLLYLDIYD